VCHPPVFNQHHASGQGVDQALQAVVGAHQIGVERIDLAGQLLVPTLKRLRRLHEQVKGAGQVLDGLWGDGARSKSHVGIRCVSKTQQARWSDDPREFDVAYIDTI
jgi:hypothetical protein